MSIFSATNEKYVSAQQSSESQLSRQYRQFFNEDDRRAGQQIAVEKYCRSPPTEVKMSGLANTFLYL